jgi:hypothetical protein
MNGTAKLLLAAALSAGVCARDTRAAEYGTGPWIKGTTDYLGGVLPSSPGLYIRNDVHHYAGNADLNIFSGRIHIDVDQAYLMDFPALMYVTPVKILGGTYTVSVIPTLMQLDVESDISIPALSVPVGPFDPTAGPFNLRSSGNEFAQGDTAFSPLILGWQRGDLYWNVGVFALAPTGEYSLGSVANTSLHHWSVMPRLAATYLDPKTGLEITGAAIYSVSWQNAATEYETGNILNLEGAVTKSFGQFGFGAVGYAMIQTTPDSGRGAVLGTFESRVYGAGPILTYSLRPESPTPLTFIAKWYHEFGAENTFEGNIVDVAATFRF